MVPAGIETLAYRVMDGGVMIANVCLSYVLCR